MSDVRTLHRARRSAADRATLTRVLPSELVARRRKRSTTWTLLVSALSSVGFGVLAAWSVLRHAAAQPGRLDPTVGALAGVSPAVIAIAVLTLLAMTGEHATGSSRSITAVPRRSVLLLARGLALVAVTLHVMLLSAIVALATAGALLASRGLPISLGTPGILQAVVGAGLTAAVVAVVATLVGLRHPSGRS